MYYEEFSNQICRLRKDAKVTHPAYGIINTAASRDILEKITMVTTILINNITISANASCGDLRPKKMNDHSTFKIS